MSDIKEQFVEKLDAAEWMSKEVRKLGIQKGVVFPRAQHMLPFLISFYLVHNIVQKIGYPTKSPDIRNASLLEDYYQTVNISKAAFFKNALSIAGFDTLREWSALGKPTDRDEWGMTVPTVNVRRRRQIYLDQNCTTHLITFIYKFCDNESWLT